jgi:hypothetical protein
LAVSPVYSWFTARSLELEHSLVYRFQEVELGVAELGFKLGAGVEAGAPGVLSPEAAGALASDVAAPFPDSDAVPEPVSDPDSEAGALLLAA